MLTETIASIGGTCAICQNQDIMSVFKMIELYHGSPNIIAKPVWGVGNARNDYGLGFYCTEEIELAKEWACPTHNDGFANRYSIDMDGLDSLVLSSKRYNILNWLAILLENRSFDMSTPIARDAKAFIISRFIPEYISDSYFSFAKAFINNAVPLSVLVKAMKLGKPGIQTCIKSETAFSRLSFKDAISVDGDEYFIWRITRDRNAREKLLDGKNGRDAVYIMDIIRQDWRNDDNRIYLGDAMQTAGAMMDCAVNVLGCPAEEFCARFLSSGIAARFSKGDVHSGQIRNGAGNRGDEVNWKRHMRLRRYGIDFVS